jgi:hypothetical protein
VHAARLHVGADQHAKPNQIDPELVGDGGQQRNDDESDLEDIDKERHLVDEGGYARRARKGKRWRR